MVKAVTGLAKQRTEGRDFAPHVRFAEFIRHRSCSARVRVRESLDPRIALSLDLQAARNPVSHLAGVTCEASAQHPRSTRRTELDGARGSPPPERLRPRLFLRHVLHRIPSEGRKPIQSSLISITNQPGTGQGSPRLPAPGGGPLLLIFRLLWDRPPPAYSWTHPLECPRVPRAGIPRPAPATTAVLGRWTRSHSCPRWRSN